MLADMNLPQQEAFLRDAKAIAEGGISSSQDEARVSAAELVSSISSMSDWLHLSLVALLAAGGIFYAWSQIVAEKRSVIRLSV